MSETAAKKNIQKLQRAIVDGLEDVKAQDIQVFNTEALSPLFERVIVASGTSNRQTKALAASVRDAVREAGFDKPRIEGEENGEWIIVDCGAAVAHVMQPSIRQYYRLEELWGDKPVRIKHAAQAKIAQPSDNAASPARKVAKPRKAAPAVAEVAPVSAKRVRKSLAASAAVPAPAPANKTPARKAAAGAAAPAKSTASRSAKPTRSAPIKVVKVGLDAAKSASKKAAPGKTPARKAPAKVVKAAKPKA
jgi:ribosome-associated protein